MHLDVEVEDAAAGVGRAVALGATHVAAHDRWQTMHSPGGLPFCFVPATGSEVPAPVTWPDGHRSRMAGAGVRREVARRESPLQLLFQRLEDEEGRVRAHLDHGTDDRDAEVRRLVGLGAEAGATGGGWQVLRDPADLAFCVTDNSPSIEVPRDLS